MAWIATVILAQTVAVCCTTGIFDFHEAGFQINYDSFPIRDFITGLFVPLIFWSVMAVPLLILRTLHLRETSVRWHVESENRILDIVTRHINYSVFMKNSDRKFVYANEPMAKRLGKSPSEIIGKTDWELKIDDPAYLKSDKEAMGLDGAEARVVCRMEPNFDTLDPQNPMVFTIKSPVYAADGSVEGLVGICEPGTPRLVMETFSRLFDEMPYFATLKDRDGHIKWASRAFCEKDAGKTRKELLDMWGKLGAKDADLYSVEDAAKFRRDDNAVVKAAEKALSLGNDPIAAATKVTDEVHYFPAQKSSCKVRVTKVPWIIEEGNQVMGVLVYYHEIDSPSDPLEQ